MPQPTAPEAATPALSSTEHVIELADALSACADALHARIMADIGQYESGHVPEHVKERLRALLDDESVLRQRASALYNDAATLVVKGLAQSQQQLARLTADAAEKIRRIGVIGETTSLVGGLLSLAGAVASGQPAGIVAAFQKVQYHARVLETLAPPAAKG